MTPISTLQPTGPRLRTSTCGRWILAVCVSLITVTASTAPYGADIESLILPGIDLSEADLHVGNWVRYLVIDEAEGIADTTTVTFAVTGEKDGAYWLEIENRPHRDGGEPDVLRVLVDSAITTYAYGDSLYRYIREIYTRKGLEAEKAGDPLSARRLTLARPASEEGWVLTSEVTLQTQAGSVVCELREMTVVDRREVPAGRVKVVRNHEDRFRVWSSDTIPVFHLTKCVIDRVRESRTIPAVQGIPDAGPRTSKTTSVVIAFGHDATPVSP